MVKLGRYNGGIRYNQVKGQYFKEKKNPRAMVIARQYFLVCERLSVLAPNTVDYSP